MSAKAKKILSLTLAILFLMQGIHPVFATEGPRKGENKIKVEQSEVPLADEPQNEVETSEESISIDPDDTITIPSERETIDEIEKAPVEVPVEEPEESVLGQELENGESKIVRLPKTNYRVFDQVDLRDIEILSKSYDGDVAIFTYADLISDPNVQLSLKDGDYLPTQFYYSLFNLGSLRNENAKTQEALGNYINSAPSQNVITIAIPNTDPVEITVQISNNGLSPLELLHAIQLPRGGAIVKNTDRLSYRPSESVDLGNLELIYKNEADQLQIIKGREIGNYFRIDDRQYEVDRALLMNKVKSEALQGLEGPSPLSTLDLSRFTRNITSKPEPQVVETYVTLEGNGHNNLYIPMTITNSQDTLSLDRGSNLEMTDLGREVQGNQNIYKFKLDVNNISSMRQLELEFLDKISASQDIKVKNITKTDGRHENYVDFKDSVGGMSFYSSAAHDMGDNRAEISTDLYAGNKYFITVEASEAVKTLEVRSEAMETNGVERRVLTTSASIEDQTPVEEPEAPTEDIEIPDIETPEIETPIEENEKPDEKTDESKEPDETVDTPDQEVEDSDEKTENPADKAENPEEEEKTEDPEAKPDGQEESADEEAEVPNEEEVHDQDVTIENVVPDFEINDLEFFPVRAAGGITANLNVKKTDEFGKPLSGASFKLSQHGSSRFYTFTSNENEYHTITGIEPGTYTLEETAAPEGYIKSNITYTVTVDPAGNITTEENDPANATSSELADDALMGSLGLSPDFSFHALQASGESVIQVSRYELVPSKGPGVGNPPIINFNSADSIKLNLELNVSNAAKRGDTFSIALDKNLVPSQIMPLSPENSPGYTWTPPALQDDYGNLIATGVYNSYTNSIIYTFTSFVDNKENIKVGINLGNIGPNKQNIKQNGVYTFTNSIDGVAQAPASFNINYGTATAPNTLPSMDGKNAITEINPQEKKIRYVAYINPDGSGPSYPTNITIQENATYPNNILYMDQANVSFYKIPKSLVRNQDLIPDSMTPDMAKLERYRDNTISIYDVGTNAKGAYLGYKTQAYAYVMIADIPYRDNADKINLGFKWSSTSPNVGGYVTHNAFIGIKGSSGDGSGDEIRPEPQDTSVTVVNKMKEEQQYKTGSFTIDKTDNNNRPLDGAIFELESRDEKNYRVTLDQSVNGKFTVEKIPPGSYILREVAAPENYKKTDKEWNVFVNSAGQVFIEEFGNFAQHLEKAVKI